MHPEKEVDTRDDEITQPSSPRARRDLSPTADPHALSTEVRRTVKATEVFLRNVPGQLDQIALAVASESHSEVRVRTHQLKGSCEALGATSMTDLCAKLEVCPQSPQFIVELLRIAFVAVRFKLLDELRAKGRITI